MLASKLRTQSRNAEDIDPDFQEEIDSINARLKQASHNGLYSCTLDVSLNAFRWLENATDVEIVENEYNGYSYCIEVCW